MTREQLGSSIIAWEESLYRVAKTLLHNNEDCADAIQESIVKAFSNIHTLKQDEHAKTWLVRILINECYMIMRKEKKLISFDAISDKAAMEREDYTDLYEAVSKLSVNMRTAIILYYGEEFTIKEIATIEDTTESAIKNRLFKARNKLREQLEYREGLST